MTTPPTTAPRPPADAATAALRSLAGVQARLRSADPATVRRADDLRSGAVGVRTYRLRLVAPRFGRTRRVLLGRRWMTLTQQPEWYVWQAVRLEELLAHLPADTARRRVRHLGELAERTAVDGKRHVGRMLDALLTCEVEGHPRGWLLVAVLGVLVSRDRPDLTEEVDLSTPAATDVLVQIIEDHLDMVQADVARRLDKRLVTINATHTPPTSKADRASTATELVDSLVADGTMTRDEVMRLTLVDLYAPQILRVAQHRRREKKQARDNATRALGGKR